MARPVKIGLDYFPMETDFFERDDVNLLVAEFGWKGAIVYLGLLTRIYKNGYFYQWGEDVCLLFCQKMGAGLVPTQVNEVVNGCIRRSLFDKRVFDMFKILTSETIQQTYIDAKQKSNYAMIDERFCLLKTKTENQPELFPKKPELFPEKPELFPDLVHKEKQSKAEQRKENNANAAALDENLPVASRPLGVATSAAPPDDLPLAATDEIGVKAEFTVYWSTFKPGSEYQNRKNTAQNEWCSLPPDKRAMILQHLSESRKSKKKLWTDNPLYYLRYFDEHVEKDYKIPYSEFVHRFGTTSVAGYCILKEKDEEGNIFFADTRAAKAYHWEIDREC